MRINNNMMAMNTHRQLGMANTGGAKSMEKLSSGLRINRAGDDAAGLAISEKMRGQIRGLNQASSNAQDGISLIQTTEGALNETHAILQRMRELAVQSSTDTNTDADRTNIQDEINELTAEITRIAETTEFNTMSLLDGTFSDKKFHIGANSSQNVTLEVNAMDSDSLGLLQAAGNSGEGAGTLAGVTIIDGSGKATSITFAAGAADNKIDIADATDAGLVAITVGSTATASELVEALKEKGFKVEIDENKFNGGTAVGATPGTVTMKKMTEIKNPVETKVDYQATAGTSKIEVIDKSGKLTEMEVVGTGTTAADIKAEMKDGKLTVTLSATSTHNTKAAIEAAIKEATGSSDVYTVTAAATVEVLATDKLEVTLTGEETDIPGVLDVSTQKSADKAVTTVNNALETVSKERSKLGAMQNRLEHTIKNLDTSAENLQASEARIRDVDMAKEMMEQTKNNILAQASTAMLANANSAPQSVLQLLG